MLIRDSKRDIYSIVLLTIHFIIMNLEKTRREYVAVYGETCPCSFLFKPFFPDNFQGIKFGKKEIRFYFKKLSNDLSDLLEIQFRNRLSRKISFVVNEADNYFGFALDMFAKKEKDEIARTIGDLKRYFLGAPMSPRLMAEISLHRKGLDWRDEKLIMQEIGK